MKNENLKKKTSKKSVFLSKDVVPLVYDIQLKPDLHNFTFEGVETIKLSLLKPVKNLTLHSKELEIETATISAFKSKEKHVAKISYNEETETVNFSFSTAIPLGKHNLTIVFKGILNDKMRGFYKSTYQIADTTHHLATTQFEATDARRAFPCFDEPAQKAVFNVSLVVAKGKTAISNTLPVSVLEHEAGFEIIKFSPTPKMSTYLLAFIVGDLEHIKRKTKNGTEVRVFTTVGKLHQAEFSLDCAVKVLEFYEEYFDIDYPLPALDMIAIPDFAAGAMENWGAVTYRESMLLVDKENSSASTKQWVALVIAHELAHQWFGNLVTMQWWTDLWLNEGFASYIEFLAVDKLFPHWDIWTQFATADFGVALRLDGLANTHPIEVKVHHPSEIGEIFDEVSYHKGASVIRMLAEYLGEEKFRDGLRHYLKKHSYKNTVTTDLWHSFEKVSRKPVSKMMHNWTAREGYPVVHASLSSDSQGTEKDINLYQERFFGSSVSAKTKKDNTTWFVPVAIAGENSKFGQFTLCGKELKIPFGEIDSTWLKINIGEAGFYRTSYSAPLLEGLRTPVLRQNISARDRLGIVRDLFALSEAGYISTTLALEFLTAYENEDNYNVWLEIASGLARIEQLVAKTPTEKYLEKYIIQLFSPQLIRLGWERRDVELHADALLRSLVISKLGRAGDQKVVRQARFLVKGIQNGEQINPDIRGAIYAVVASNGGTKEYNAFVKQYKSETLHEEKNRIGVALGDFNDKEILCLSAHFALSSDVRIQDSIGILSSIASNPMGRDVWVTTLKTKWQILIDRYGDGGYSLARLLKAIGASAEKKHLKFFETFFKTNNAPGAVRAIEQVKEKLESNIEWLARDGKKIAKFLQF